MTSKFDIGELYFQKVKDRMAKYNKNFLLCVCGGTGSGKSYSAISIADKISPNGFNPETMLAFTAKRFMEIITSGKLKKGDAIVFDEAGVSMDAKSWYSIQNKLLNYVLQTFRHLNLCVIFTVPALRYIDNSARLLFHTYMETKTILHASNLCKIKVFNFQYNSMNDKIYRHIPKFSNPKGILTSMDFLYVKIPKDDLIEKYEAEKNKYTSELNKNIIQELDNLEKDKTPKGQGCAQCGGRRWQHRRTNDEWYCRTCGHISQINPFLTPT